MQVLASPFQMSHLESKKHDIGLHQMSKWTHFRNVFANKLNKLWRRRRFAGIHSLCLVINEAFKYEYRHSKCLLALSTHDQTHTYAVFRFANSVCHLKAKSVHKLQQRFLCDFHCYKKPDTSKEKSVCLEQEFMCCWCKRNEQSGNVLL